MTGIVCLVTGASSGIGRATAAKLAKSGAKVVMVSRDKTSGKLAMDEIIRQTQNQSVDLLAADLSSMVSVRALVSDFEGRYPSLNVLVNCAGIYTNTRAVTQEGFELMFATNYLGPFLLTRLLLPRLEAGSPSRIINVTAPSTVRPNIDDLQGERKFGALNAFGASKAADLLFTYELARRLVGRNLTVNAYHPGLVRTKLMSGAPLPIRFVAGVMNIFAGRDPEHAGEELYELAISDQFAQTSGKLMHKGKAISGPFIDDRELQERLWKKSCELVGMSETV